MNNDKQQLQRLNYWNDFYANNYNKKVLSIPSQFCCLMATEIEPNEVVVEFGCGSGRDSIFLANNNLKVFAMDLSPIAIKKNNEITSSYSNISFHCGDVAVKEDVTNLLKKGRSEAIHSLIIYSRFFLHSLDEKQQASFISSLSQEMVKGDKLYFEFRTDLDLNREKIFKNHFRRFVNKDKLIQDLKNHKFEIIYQIEGSGMAKFKEEDPIVARIIAKK